MLTSLASFLRRRFAPVVRRDSSIRHSAKIRRTRRLSLESLEPLCMLSGYTITDLGTLGGDYSESFGINNRGEIVGISDTGLEDPINGLLSDAFLFSRGRLTDLGTLGGQFSGARTINENGQIVGYAQTDDPDPVDGPIHAVLWDNGAPRDLGTVAGKLFSEAWDINNRGQVTGRAFNNNPDANPVTSPPDTHVFLWEKGVMTDLPLPTGFKNPFTGAINDRGQIAGYAADDTTVHPLVWQQHAGKFEVTDVGIPAGYIRGVLRTINNRGEVSGSARTANRVSHAFVWRPDGHGQYVPQDLGGLGGQNAESRDINSRGQVVGVATTAVGDFHAFLFDSAGMHDLNDLIPAASGWIVDTARSINDRGQIVGFGNHDGHDRAFLLTPTDNEHALRPAGDGNWVLHVAGSKQADSVSIVGLGPDTSGGDTVQITVNGTTTTYGNIVSVVVQTDNGDDNVSLTGKWSAASMIKIDLGAGNDVATLHDNTCAGPLQLAIDAGAGNDAVSMDHCSFTGPNDPLRTDASIAIRLGAGDDTATLRDNTFAGNLQLAIDAGAGNDTIAIEDGLFELVPPIPRGSLDIDVLSDLGNLSYDASFQIDLGAGNDQFLMQGNLLGDLSFSLDAGSGDDIATIKDNTGEFKANIDMGSGGDRLTVLIPTDPCVLIARLGVGNDTADIQLGPWTDLAEPKSFFVDGGAGKDHIAMTVEVPKGNTGPLDVRLLGGTGDDNLSLFATGDLSSVTTGAYLLLDGGAGSDNLVGPQDVGQKWRIDGINRGRLNGNIRFVSFESLVGGDFDDTFVFLLGSFVSGEIDGGEGRDTLDYRPRGSQLDAGPRLALNIEKVLY